MKNIAKAKFDVTKHVLVQKHIKATEKEKTALFEKYNVTAAELPKMSKKDPVAQKLGLKQGDMVKIMRNSPVAGEIVFYRMITDA